MQPPTVIIHERLAEWSRQLKPRFRGGSIRWCETRSRTDLLQACERSVCPILVINTSRDPSQGLEDLDAALRSAPRALSLILEGKSRPGVISLARELGATLVLSSVVVPPDVVNLIHRWLPIASHREESLGWSASVEPDREIWDHPDPIAAVSLQAGR